MVSSGMIPPVLPGITFVHHAVVAIGLLLAWRFHSSRIFFALIVLFLAREAIVHASSAHGGEGGHTTLVVVGFLLPLNFVLLSLEKDRPLAWSGLAPAGVF